MDRDPNGILTKKRDVEKAFLNRSRDVQYDIGLYGYYIALEFTREQLQSHKP